MEGETHEIVIGIEGTKIEIEHKVGFSIEDEITVSDWPEALQVIEVLLVEHFSPESETD